MTMSVAEPESPVLKTPEWLEVLENKRKRPHKLAHDIGAGAPCLICKDACKGLNLHFWRKLCIECKCRKEDHEVQEEEDYAQFEILFGAKKVKRTTLKFNAQNKSFDWVPPNIPPELAVDYLKSIPQSKVPISNSEGARHRKQQLEKQLPLHDVDPNVCHNLSDNEMQEFQKYLANLKNNVIGQGKVLKYQYPKMLKENYIKGSSPNIMISSGEYQNFQPQGGEVKGHLTVDKIPGYSASSQQLNTESYPAEGFLSMNSSKSQPISSLGTDFHALRSHPLKKNENNYPSHQHSSLKFSDMKFKSPKPYFPVNDTLREETKLDNSESVNYGQPFNTNLRTPSSFINRKFPIHDTQNNNTEALHQDDNFNEKVEDLPIESSIQHSFQPSDVAYSENVGGKSNITRESCLKPFEQAPYDAKTSRDPLDKFKELNVSSTDVPFVPVRESGNMFVPYRYGYPMKEQENKPEDHTNSFPTPPATCQQCLEILNPGEVVVQAERGGNLALWHAKCFVCETCKELLVDLMYFFHKGKVYCGRHYAEIMKIPRCHACDELIFVKEYTCAEGESYHVRHFCCFHCDQSLGGKQYIPKDNQPVCLDCYQEKYGKNCRTCLLPIAAGEQRVSWKELDFHVSPKCFRCAKCLKSLLGGRFLAKNDHVFCSKECVQQFDS